jgi:ABC-type hemin transport system substrate-binding protein
MAEPMGQTAENLGQQSIKIVNIPAPTGSASLNEKLDNLVAMVEANDENLTASVEALKGDIKKLTKDIDDKLEIVQAFLDML